MLIDKRPFEKKNKIRKLYRLKVTLLFFCFQIKNLTHLDVSENSIEKLDISALQELRSVRCARNHLAELTLCGRNLVSLIAGNNSEYRLFVRF